MSIKSDRWIRRMAASQGMIEPFSPGQVREADGHKIISYGTSSYGYDVRCAEEFKIFTNINSTIVDPKNFDEKSFVDFKGPVCIIPPNSFALARTVEFFRIPRSVLTVCLGKCVTGDTRVVDADTGAYVPITDMQFGKSTLALDGSMRIKPAKVSAFVPQGKKEVFELRTLAGIRIRATSNHPFLKLNGWVPLSDLRPGDRIAAARNIPVFGTTPIADQEAGRLAEELSGGASAKCVPQSIFTAPEPSVRVFLQSLFTSRGGVNLSDTSASVEYSSNSRRLVEDVHHLLLRFSIVSEIRENMAANGVFDCKIEISDRHQVLRFAEKVAFTEGSVQQQALAMQAIPLIRSQATGSMLQRVAGRGVLTGDGSLKNALMDGPLWDEVESIMSVGEEEVYDISVPVLHNFIANDLIVHNSTYARCFRGDTRVALVDGTSATLEGMAKRHEAGELFWGYSIGQNGRMIASLLDAPRYIGRDSLLEIELDNGELVHATPDHLFMRRDGRMTEAHTLRPNDALMPLYRDLARGYEQIYQPVDGFLYPTHRMADEWNLRHDIYEDAPGTHRHHMDFDRRNNKPANIVRRDASEHIRLHNAENYGEGFDSEEHGRAISDAVQKRALDPEWRERFSQVQAHRATEFRNSDRYAEIRRNLIDARRNPTDATREAHRQAMLRRFSDPAERARHAKAMVGAWAKDNGDRRRSQAEIARRIKLRAEITEETVLRALNDTGSIRGAAEMLNCDRSVFRRFPETRAHSRGTPAYRNHKVVAIRELAGDHDVYCLTVPEAGNFALEAGIFVHNCGIIVNVTPLEPEWEGHVTLEFSNTTPLPAKIYANEGVAQMLFFESDEVCETSYKDRGGKYQGQLGVTLPKA